MCVHIELISAQTTIVGSVLQSNVYCYCVQVHYEPRVWRETGMLTISEHGAV